MLVGEFFFCLHSVFERCIGHNTGPIVLILCQLVYSGPRTMANFVSENRPGNFFFAMETNRSMTRFIGQRSKSRSKSKS